jgi:hypothetical protein
MLVSKDNRQAPAHTPLRARIRVIQRLKDSWTHYESSWGFSMMEPVSCRSLCHVLRFVLTVRSHKWEKIFLRA